MSKIGIGPGTVYRQLVVEQARKDGTDVVKFQIKNKPGARPQGIQPQSAKKHTSPTGPPPSGYSKNNLGGGKTRRKVIYIRKYKKSTHKSKPIKTSSKRNLHSRNTRKHINVRR